MASEHFTSHRPLALITGASRGIGYNFAVQLAARGYDLLLVSLSEDKLTKASQRITATYPVAITTIATDLATLDGAQRIIDHCTLYHLTPEVLINNAGIFNYQETINCSSEYLQRIILLHNHTPTQLCHHFGGLMRKAGVGYIVNISSLSNWYPCVGIGPYAATKSYLYHFSQTLREELRQSGVKVLVVSPGGVATDLYGLPHHLQQLGIRLGILQHPETIARQTIKPMFRGKRKFTPGWINHPLKAISHLIPLRLIHYIQRKIYPPPSDGAR